MRATRPGLKVALLCGAALLVIVGMALWLRRPSSAPTPLAADRLADSLRMAKSPEVAKENISELRASLSASTPQAASATIQGLLRSKVDAPSGLDFKIGPGGLVTEPSSLRVFLMDQLARVDLPAAGAYAKEVLATMDSPDEWAVSLRNYAMANTNQEARVFLLQKMEAMLRHEPWQKDPSVGFLEAFDVAAYLGGTELLPALTKLLRRKDNRAVAHAAYLALDRLVLRDPTAVLNELQLNSELMKGREHTRANYFARANLEDAQQRAVVENYLLSPNLSAPELQTFAGIFPNANLMISHNLLTQQPTLHRDTLLRQGEAAQESVDRWLADPRFARLRPQLEAIKGRLEQLGLPGGPPKGGTPN